MSCQHCIIVLCCYSAKFVVDNKFIQIHSLTSGMNFQIMVALESSSSLTKINSQGQSRSMFVRSYVMFVYYTLTLYSSCAIFEILTRVSES